MQYTNVIEKVKPSKLGSVEIRHDTPSDFEIMRAAFGGMPLERRTYVRLIVSGQTMMTDARFERITNADLLHNAKGNALVAGLGIGLILDPLLRLCASVTVVEKHKDVIALVAPSFPSVNVVHADIFDWTPAKGTKFDTIYFDIWPEISSDQVKEGQNLQRRFRKYLAAGGWMRSWSTIAYRACGRGR